MAIFKDKIEFTIVDVMWQKSKTFFFFALKDVPDRRPQFLQTFVLAGHKFIERVWLTVSNDFVTVKRKGDCHLHESRKPRLYIFVSNEFEDYVRYE